MNARISKTDQAQQERAIAFLANPASHEPACDSVERIDTHGAIVFLAGANAYKIKRAIHYSYMDFSSLDKRENFCRRELAINLPSAPQLYHAVIPITLDPDGSLHIDGNGKPIEWAIHMHRFDQGSLLANVARQAALSSELSKAIAQKILAFHGQKIPKSSGSAAQQLGSVVDILCNFFQQQPQQDHQTDEQQQLNSLADRICGELRSKHSQLSDLLNRRADNGFVVRGHGDLHLSNIVILEKTPVLFDALEFDETLATVDVLYDLAFLLMDLCMLGRRSSANEVFNQYLYQQGSAVILDGLRAMPLFLALRAGVRAMVAIQRSALNESTTVGSAIANAAEYLHYADKALSPRATRLIAVGGLSGSGKSTLARRLAPDVGAEPGALHIRSDLERKSQWHVTETMRLPKSAYSAGNSARVYQSMLEKAEHSLRAGHSVVVDAVFAEPTQRQAFTELADKCGASFSGIWLRAKAPIMRRRIEERRDDASDATGQVLNHQLSKDTGTIDWAIVNADGDAAHTLGQAKRTLPPGEVL